MPFHHVAAATNDLDATHRFSTEAADALRRYRGVPPLGDGPGIRVHEAEKAG